MGKRTYLNPYLVYTFSWFSVFILYHAGWSELYPDLSTDLCVFLICTIIVTGFFGFWLSYKRYIIYHPLKFDLKKVRKISIIYILANLLEILYSREIPFLSILINGKVNRTDFGIPILHPLIVTLGIFLGLYIFHMMRSTDKKNKFKLFPYFILSFLSVVIVFGRGLMFMTLLGCIMIYVMSTTFKKKTLLGVLCSIIGILYLFGWAGNVRIGESGVKITTIGQATTKFEESKIPSEFFWSYLYFSSPLANLEYNLEIDKIEDINLIIIKQLYISEIIPQFISNKILSEDQKVEPNLITNALNVCSVYTRCYLIAGWMGIWIMFGYIFIYTFFMLSIVSPRSPYFVVMVVGLNLLMAGNVFDNMMNYLLSYTLFFPIFFMITDKCKLIIRNAAN